MDTILLGYSIFLKVSGPKIYSLKISGLLYLYLLKYDKIETQNKQSAFKGVKCLIF